MSLIDRSSCAECKKALLPNAELICDKCRSGFHTKKKCCGLGKEEVDRVLADGSRIFYLCRGCHTEGAESGDLKEDNDGSNLGGLIATLRSELMAELDSIKSTLRNSGGPSGSDWMEDIYAELNERKSRENSIIAFNLVEDPLQHIDAQNISRVLHLVAPDVPTEGVRTFRLGRRVQDKVRPLKIILDNSQQVRTILRNKIKLRDSEFSAVSIQPDQTIRQRRYMSSLRKSLEERRAEGETNLTIKFFNGFPKIVSASPKN